jgi:glutathionylspermidine synthase
MSPKPPSSNISTKEPSLFSSLGMPFSQSNKDYAILDTIDYDKIGLSVSQQELDKIVCQLATIIDEQAKTVGRDDKLIDSLGYPAGLKGHFDGNLAMMRLGFVVSTSGKPFLIEVNSQTPSFWWECETGADKVLGEFGKLRSPSYIGNFQNCIKEQVANLSTKMGIVGPPSVGLVTCDNEDDIFQMSFLKNSLDSLNVSSYSEILTIDKMDIATNDRVFSINTDKEFDILFFWYPLEWLVSDNFADGTRVSNRLFGLVDQNKVQLINGFQSFVAQNKNLLAYITETSNGNTNPLHPNFLPTYYTLEEFESCKIGPDWIGKPIFGREGKGIFGKQNGRDILGDCTDSYYNDQWYVYQGFIQTMPIFYNKKSFDFTFEKWVYKVDGIWKSGGQALRISTEQITDNKSSWLTIS